MEVSLLDKNAFIINTAAERDYQNQSEKYKTSFTKWRNNPKNRYGYRFVHDSREHTYIDGEGFADQQCRAAEISSLHSCLQFLGTIMLIYFFIEQVTYIILKLLYAKVHINMIYLSHIGETAVVSAEEVYLFCALRLFLVTAVIVIGRITLRLPLNVMLPAEHQHLDRTVYMASSMIVIAMILRTADVKLCDAMQHLRIDSYVYIYIKTSDSISQALFIITEMVLFPLLLEIFMRGMILQLFRQFGDCFAIFVTALAECCCYHELSKMLFWFIMSAAFSVMMIKTGNVVYVMVTRLVISNLILLLNTLSIDQMKLTNLLIEKIIVLVVLALSFSIMFGLRVHRKKPYRIKHDSTELDLSTKLRQVVNAPVAILWLLCIMLTLILSVKLI